MKRTIVLIAITLFACSPKTPDVQLSAPPTGKGFQIDIAPFTVPAGTETQSCYFLAVPGQAGEDVWVNRFTIAGNTGTHHMNLFRVKTIVNLGGQPGDVVKDGQCWTSSNWADWPLVVNSQDGGKTVDWQL